MTSYIKLDRNVFCPGSAVEKNVVYENGLGLKN
jgi:hypothetical protein